MRGWGCECPDGLWMGAHHVGPHRKAGHQMHCHGEDVADQHELRGTSFFRLDPFGKALRQLAVEEDLFDVQFCLRATEVGWVECPVNETR